MTPKPRAPLPKPMTGRDRNSWAHDTITRRWPEIAMRLLKDNTLSSSQIEEIEALRAELPDAPIREIRDPQAPDIEAWNGYIEPYRGKGWLEVPWFFGEHYFYRRVMEAVGYFQPGIGGRVDPFVSEKQRGLNACIGAVRELAARLSADAVTNLEERLFRMFYLARWGNQADLSLWPAEGEDKPDHGAPEKGRAYLLADDLPLAVDLLCPDRAVARVDILIDNAGFEPACEQRRANRLKVREDFFWTSPLPAWEMPKALRDELSSSSLTISKGDAHYRRLLGDRDWSHVTRFADVLSYFPSPILALRTLKAELVCGIAPEEEKRAASKDSNWMTDGRWGSAQLANPRFDRIQPDVDCPSKD